MTQQSSYHSPVLLEESIDGLAIHPSGVYVDVTYGGGGHSREILSRLGEDGKLFAFDQDLDALENVIDDPRFVLINQNFRFMKRFLRMYGVKEVDGILADLGVSSHQFDEADRGFSTRFDARLDMRMNQESELDAVRVVNDYDEDDLNRIFKEYGELRIAPRLTRAIIAKRDEGLIETVAQLKEICAPFVPERIQHKMLAQVFQAIRIEVNQEMDVLEEFLVQSKEILKTGGRLSVISYHSLEDRPVKRFMRNGLFHGEPEKDVFGRASVPFKKVGKLIVPTAAQIKENNRARSAKLRIAQRIED
ncbi:MAG: 16S rRNA (cytosine(1402)-N(4))-methyltransferase RsmH [Nonlabens ulvanivorans]|uniref:Ribosomal RNA small subunit methyltransferase H n=6 Tax=Nonlabens ulvanivorans TaxID=906888 RepID=A0A084JYQ8_NONUL|nr:16S rRNA (cytosine(1402)-N(4))-methyltransferase RsmH [Nonlabens ulvanivorans]KEZ94092.1 16S rRNA methyltransferase [Nonlabens ulvanivorans]PRX13078.1 16S rRNA (cytosine1402-N4)-methyltransferase [Nonlabens ulvanivorans]WOI21830.1 16S rRNA (cytosine(1402)-N(4))-methyltransferase RsmH [Nonlabens ulvanivorans]GAL74673.1 rRNA small subunit methyltransferase H [Nonlabens ulvanivorans]